MFGCLKWAYMTVGRPQNFVGGTSRGLGMGRQDNRRHSCATVTAIGNVGSGPAKFEHVVVVSHA